MIVVDTTVWVDYFGGQRNPATEWLDRELDRQRFALTDLILCEVLQGIRDDRVFRKVRLELRRFALIENGGEDIAVASAENFRTLRRQGITVRKTVDCLIATCCLLRGYALLHRDRDFDAFERIFGLRVVHP